MLRRKRFGARTEPWGTPALIGKRVEQVAVNGNRDLSIVEEAVDLQAEFDRKTIRHELTKKCGVPDFVESFRDVEAGA